MSLSDLLKDTRNPWAELRIESLQIDDDLEVNGDLELKGNTEINGDLDVVGDIAGVGTLLIGGDTQFNSDVNIGGTITNIKPLPGGGGIIEEPFISDYGYSRNIPFGAGTMARTDLILNFRESGGVVTYTFNYPNSINAVNGSNNTFFRWQALNAGSAIPKRFQPATSISGYCVVENDNNGVLYNSRVDIAFDANDLITVEVINMQPVYTATTVETDPGPPIVYGTTLTYEGVRTNYPNPANDIKYQILEPFSISFSKGPA